MKKFFNLISQQLLSANRFYRYLIYATGEIFLVVIGILIAVQINNWNEQNKRVKTEIIYLKEIRKSLQSDLENEITPCIQAYENALNAYSLLNNNFYNSSEEISQDSIKNLFISNLDRWKLVLNTVVFDNVKSIGIDLISNDTLRMNISNLYGFNYKHLAELQSTSEKFNYEQTMPAWADVFVDWSGKSVKSKAEINLIRGNSHLHAIIINSNFLMSEELNFLKEYVQLVNKTIEDIGKEIEHLE